MAKELTKSDKAKAAREKAAAKKAAADKAPAKTDLRPARLELGRHLKEAGRIKSPVGFRPEEHGWSLTDNGFSHTSGAAIKISKTGKVTKSKIKSAVYDDVSEEKHVKAEKPAKVAKVKVEKAEKPAKVAKVKVEKGDKPSKAEVWADKHNEERVAEAKKAGNAAGATRLSEGIVIRKAEAKKAAASDHIVPNKSGGIIRHSLKTALSAVAKHHGIQSITKKAAVDRGWSIHHVEDPKTGKPKFSHLSLPSTMGRTVTVHGSGKIEHMSSAKPPVNRPVRPKPVTASKPKRVTSPEPKKRS